MRTCTLLLLFASVAGSQQPPSVDPLIAALARAKAVGLPLKAHELGIPTLAPKCNAAVEFRVLAKAPYSGQVSKLVSQAEPLVLEALFTRDVKARTTLASKARQVFDRATVLRIAEKATAKPGLSFGYDWDSIYFSINAFPNMALLKVMTKAFVARAILSAIEGKEDGAIADIQRVDKLIEFAGSEPTVIAMLVMVAMADLQNTAMARTAFARPADHEFLGRLGGICERRKSLDLPRAIRGDFYVSLNLRRYVEPTGPKKQRKTDGSLAESLIQSVHGAEQKPMGLPKDPKVRAHLATYLEEWAWAWPQILRNRDRATQIGRTLVELRDRFQGHVAMGYPQDSVESGLEEIAKVVPGTQAKHVTTLAYLKVLRFHALHDRWPKNLSEAGASMADPFARKPLRYALAADGFKVWSVGPDGVDNGGKPRVRAASSFDVVRHFPPLK